VNRAASLRGWRCACPTHVGAGRDARYYLPDLAPKPDDQSGVDRLTPLIQSPRCPGPRFRVSRVGIAAVLLVAQVWLLSGDFARAAFPGQNGKIAFNLPTDPSPFGTGPIYIMNADGSGQTRLTNYYASATDSPAWSPDGKKIAFAALYKNGTHPDIYVMNADGSGQTRLTNSSIGAGSPAWSPDGKKIAFSRFGVPAPCGDSIYIMNANGSGQKKLMNGDTPAWSPDGKKIAFAACPVNTLSFHEIYVVNANGSNQTKLTNFTGGALNPNWQAVGHPKSHPKNHPKSPRPDMRGRYKVTRRCKPGKCSGASTDSMTISSMNFASDQFAGFGYANSGGSDENWIVSGAKSGTTFSAKIRYITGGYSISATGKISTAGMSGTFTDSRGGAGTWTAIRTRFLHTKGCADVAIYGVRGSTQDYTAGDLGMGPEIFRVAEEIRRRDSPLAAWRARRSRRGPSRLGLRPHRQVRRTSPA
jgi:hypothetical protein